MRRTLLKITGAALLLTSVLIASPSAGLQAASARQKPAPRPAGDVKVRTRMTTGGAGGGVETVTYLKGARMRSEMIGAGVGVANITQCDLRRAIAVNDAARTYLITPLGERPGAAGLGPVGDGGGVAAQTPQTSAARRRGGVVNITTTLTDTGERREMFGFTARRIKTSTVREASPDACDRDNLRHETDGWYIDFQFDFSCPDERKTAQTPYVPTKPGCEDEVRSRTVGSAKLGYPVLLKTTFYNKDGVATTSTQEVLEISRSPLDPALFDVPAGYALAKDTQELYGMGAAGQMNDRDEANDNRDETEGAAATSRPATPSASGASAPAGFVAANAPKRPGAVRIGIVTPKAQVTSGDAARAAEAVRNTFARSLGGPSVEVVALKAHAPAQAQEEARQGQCDYVLYASLTQKKGGGGMFGRALGNIAGGVVGHIPVDSAGEAAAVAGVYTAADIAASVKARDEVTLDYRLEATDGARPVLAKTEKAKAKADGEDVLTPLVGRAAETIVAAAARK